MALGSEAPSLRALGSVFADVYDKVSPSVVVLEVSKPESGATDFSGLDSLFRGPRRPLTPASEGSGFIIREDGYILTNAHVVEGADPRRGVVARLQDGTRLPLTVVGLDDKTDLAVLKADAEGLPAIEWGDSDAVRVGEFVCGIGSPYELDFTLTAGIISAKGRSNLTGTIYEDYLQTDAAINPGNSGGPLCDLDGRVVGVNTLINGLSRGLGFAIPSRLARLVSEQLIADGRIIWPWLGVRIETLGNEPRLSEVMGIDQGVVVRTIEPGAPASRSNLRPADVIVEVDGEAVASARDLQQMILRKSVGQEVALKVWRRSLVGGQFRTVNVTTEELPQAPLVAGRAAPRRAPGAMPAPGEAPQGIGLEVEDLSAEVARTLDLEPGGVIVTHVAEGGAAELAGLRRRDVITAVGDQTVGDAASFGAAIEDLAEGQSVVLLLERGGRQTYAIFQKP